MLRCIFYSTFDNKVGPQLPICVPRMFVTREEFDTFADYIIPKRSISMRLLTFSLRSNLIILNFPIRLEDAKYERQTFQFSFGMVVKKPFGGSVSGASPKKGRSAVGTATRRQRHSRKSEGCREQAMFGTAHLALTERDKRKEQRDQQSDWLLPLKTALRRLSLLFLQLELEENYLSSQRFEPQCIARVLQQKGGGGHPAHGHSHGLHASVSTFGSVPRIDRMDIGSTFDSGTAFHRPQTRAHVSSTHCHSTTAIERESGSRETGARGSGHLHSGWKPLRDVLLKVFSQFKLDGECTVRVCDFRKVELKLYRRLRTPVSFVWSHEVPVLITDLTHFKDNRWDMSVQHVISQVNGVRHVQRIRDNLTADAALVSECLVQLLYYEVVALIDIFQLTNRYEPTACGVRHLVQNADLQQWCLVFCLRRPFRDRYVRQLGRQYKQQQMAVAAAASRRTRFSSTGTPVTASMPAVATFKRCMERAHSSSYGTADTKSSTSSPLFCSSTSKPMMTAAPLTKDCGNTSTESGGDVSLLDTPVPSSMPESSIVASEVAATGYFLPQIESATVVTSIMSSTASVAASGSGTVPVPTQMQGVANTEAVASGSALDPMNVTSLISEVCRLFAALSREQSLLEVLVEIGNWSTNEFRRQLDIHKCIVFGVVNKMIRRIHAYPIYDESLAALEADDAMEEEMASTKTHAADSRKLRHAKHMPQIATSTSAYSLSTPSKKKRLAATTASSTVSVPSTANSTPKSSSGMMTATLWMSRTPPPITITDRSSQTASPSKAETETQSDGGSMKMGALASVMPNATKVITDGGTEARLGSAEDIEAKSGDTLFFPEKQPIPERLLRAKKLSELTVELSNSYLEVGSSKVGVGKSRTPAPRKGSSTALMGQKAKAKTPRTVKRDLSLGRVPVKAKKQRETKRRKTKSMMDSAVLESLSSTALKRDRSKLMAHMKDARRKRLRRTMVAPKTAATGEVLEGKRKQSLSLPRKGLQLKVKSKSARSVPRPIVAETLKQMSLEEFLKDKLKQMSDGSNCMDKIWCELKVQRSTLMNWVSKKPYVVVYK